LIPSFIQIGSGPAGLAAAHNLEINIQDKNMEAAMRAAEEKPFGTGIFYQNVDRAHYQDILRQLNT